MAATVKERDLHGNAPDTCAVALVLLDVLTDFDFPHGKRLSSQAAPLAPRIVSLKADTAHGAYLREYDLVVPSDCTASMTKSDNAYALGHLKRVLGADTSTSRRLDLAALCRPRRPGL